VLVTRTGGLPAALHVKCAVGLSRYLALAAKMKVGVLRIADRPAAIVVGERLNRLAFTQGDNEFCIVRGHGVWLSIKDFLMLADVSVVLSPSRLS
jgi:hypothetical protein